MNTLESAAKSTEKLFAEWGINAVTDPRNLELPGAVVMPETIVANRLAAGVLDIDWEVYLVAPDTENPFNILGEMLETISQHYLLANVQVQSLTLPNHSPDPLPALNFTLRLEYSK